MCFEHVRVVANKTMETGEVLVKKQAYRPLENGHLELLPRGCPKVSKP